MQRHDERRYRGSEVHPGHVCQLLRLLGWSWQRPTGQALERDERAIAQWAPWLPTPVRRDETAFRPPSTPASPRLDENMSPH